MDAWPSLKRPTLAFAGVSPAVSCPSLNRPCFSIAITSSLVRALGTSAR